MLQKLLRTQSAHLATWLVVSIIVSGPLNLFYKLAVSSGYVQGLPIDYLLPKVFLVDFFIGALLLLSAQRFGASWLKQLRQFRFSLIRVISIFLVVALILRQFLSPYPGASIWYLLKILEMIGLGISVIYWRPLLNLKYIWWALLVSLWLQLSLGLYQFWTQKPLAPYWLLGETRIDSYVGIAQASFNGVLKTLPYGTTAHPNVLAGTLAVYIWLAWLMRPVKQKLYLWVWLITLIPALVVLFLTQSVSAWLALGLSFSIISLQRYRPQLSPDIAQIGVVLSLISLPFLLYLGAQRLPDNASIMRRTFLNQTALLEWSRQPLWGTSLNTVAALNEKYVGPGEITRFAQPTHHLGLLWLVETGLIGVGLVTLFLHKFQRRLHWWYLLGWVPIMFLDHYFLTINGGIILFAFIVQFCWQTREIMDSVKVRS